VNGEPGPGEGDRTEEHEHQQATHRGPPHHGTWSRVKLPRSAKGEVER
jgi:hypothetical protein